MDKVQTGLPFALECPKFSHYRRPPPLKLSSRVCKPFLQDTGREDLTQVRSYKEVGDRAVILPDVGPPCQVQGARSEAECL